MPGVCLWLNFLESLSEMEPCSCVLHIKSPLSSELLFFTGIGPHDPVTAIVGQEAVLPCHLSPQMSAANMEVRWFRSQFLSFVHLYHDGNDQYDGKMPEYRRTELLKAGFTDGNVPLRILNIRRSDEGQYHSSVQDYTFYEESILELQVAAPFFSPTELKGTFDKMAVPKKAKLDVRSFQPAWTDAFGFIEKKDRAICAFCYENVVFRTSSVRHFEMKHEKILLDEADKTESIKKAVAAYEKQSSVFKSLSISKNQDTEGSYKIAQCIAKNGKPFTDGEYIQEVFLSSLEILFNDFQIKIQSYLE
uniref:Ig-like domain-containing protein n=1 Tax=Chrysemys picta bellii TaxID=8478 RepID=A0A8C3F820_CHRPI